MGIRSEVSPKLGKLRPAWWQLRFGKTPDVGGRGVGPKSGVPGETGKSGTRGARGSRGAGETGDNAGRDASPRARTVSKRATGSSDGRAVQTPKTSAARKRSAARTEAAVFV